MSFSPRRLVLAMLSPVMFLFHLFTRIFWSGLNKRNVLTLPLNFMVNFSPIFVWLMMFKNAGLIPKEIRPRIHVTFAYYMDTFMFSVSESPLGCLLTVALTASAAWLIYLKWYRINASAYLKLDNSSMTRPNSFDSDFEMSSLDSEAPKDFSDDMEAPGDFQNDPHIGKLEFLPAMSEEDVSRNSTAINRKIAQYVSANHTYRPYNCWAWAPSVLLAAAWFLLNFVHLFAKPLTAPKDVVLWFSYVLGHFFAPLFTAIWLYLFHPPGAVRLFSFALGAQNIVGVCTHLLFPNAPPWFIHMYGENGKATYDTPGYAAGLVRAPFGKGTHVVTQGFHKSPIVFGALPSLHLAMAVMCFLFVAYYARWTMAKIALFSFVMLQWWATIYLDHHWRLDLIVGMAYALLLFTVFFCWRMQRIDEDFVDARLRYDFATGSTMGMRIFRNTKLQNFFDPLS